MRGLMKVLMAAVAALIIGFGAGEVFGPEALEAGDPGECTYQQCYTTWCDPWDPEWPNCESTECRPDEEPFFCEDELGMCTTQHCYGPD